MMQVINQLKLERDFYLSLPRLFTEIPLMARLPSDHKDVSFSVRFQEVVRQLARLARKCKELRKIIESAIRPPINRTRLVAEDNQ